MENQPAHNARVVYGVILMNKKLNWDATAYALSTAAHIRNDGLMILVRNDIRCFMETLTFKLQEDNFEGPLDLLLYLVGKNKMNLCDINIMELIEQYTAAIQTMQADKLEVSSEFIDMAAHLVQMKSALLLPRSPEAERMKAELTGRLIEYSTCKQVAAELGSRAAGFVHRGAPAPKTGRPGGIFPQTGSGLLVQAWFSLHEPPNELAEIGQESEVIEFRV